MHLKVIPVPGKTQELVQVVENILNIHIFPALLSAVLAQIENIARNSPVTDLFNQQLRLNRPATNGWRIIANLQNFQFLLHEYGNCQWDCVMARLQAPERTERFKSSSSGTTARSDRRGDGRRTWSAHSTHGISRFARKYKVWPRFPCWTDYRAEDLEPAFPADSSAWTSSSPACGLHLQLSRQSSIAASSAPRSRR